MSKDKPRNMGASVRQRLTELARKQGEDFQLVLTLTLLTSRTTTRRKTGGRPARAARRSACSSRRRTTPPPTVLQPSSPMARASPEVFTRSPFQDLTRRWGELAFARWGQVTNFPKAMASDACGGGVVVEDQGHCDRRDALCRPNAKRPRLDAWWRCRRDTEFVRRTVSEKLVHAAVRPA